MTRRLTWLGLALVLAASVPDEAKDAAAGSSYKVPYQLTNTNHYLVRVRINGKGPFNFLVDTGAPALYVGTEAAQAAGLEASKSDFWTTVDRLDLEGGVCLTGIKARVEDPFQLTGMNALGLPGARIDGILGFTILAKFRMEFDPTQDRMTWTRLDYNPKEPFVPQRKANDGAPAEVQAMSALGPLMKFMALFVGKQPEDRLIPRGFLGMELSEQARGDVRVSAVLAESPAEKAGLKPGDMLLRIRGKEIDTPSDAHKAVAEVKAGAQVSVTVRRRGEELTVDLSAGGGF
jgi:hypothetical protein